MPETLLGTKSQGFNGSKGMAGLPLESQPNVLGEAMSLQMIEFG